MKFRYDKANEELIVSESSRIEYHQLQLWLSRKVKGWRYHPLVKRGLWNGEISHFRNGKINLGLWKECLMSCKEIQTKFELENKEDFPLNKDVTLDKVKDFCKDYFKNHKVKNKEGEWIPFFPYDHQIETAYKILKNLFCLSEVATSGGKSLIISIVIFYTLKNIDVDAKFLLIVPSISLVSQFYDDILLYNYGENTLESRRDKKIDSVLDNFEYCDIRVDEIMSDKPRQYSGIQNPNIYIGTYQSLEKWPKVFFEQFHTVICDESHTAKSKTIVSILERTFKYAKSRFGVSGTFPPDDSCEYLTIQSVLGPKITEVSVDELRTKGIITPMEIKCVILNHNDVEWSERITNIRKSGMGKEALILEKDYIHQSSKRIELISNIVSKCDNNVLILFHTIEYGQMVFQELVKKNPDKSFYYIDGSISGKKREEIKKELEKTDDGKIKVCVASFGTLSTGVSIKNLHYLIMIDSFKSEQIIIQSLGRLLRLLSGKAKAIIFDLVDVFDSEKPSNILYKHFEERMGFYKKRKYPFTIKKISF